METGFSSSTFAKVPTGRMKPPTSGHVAGTGRARAGDAVATAENQAAMKAGERAAPAITAEQARIHTLQEVRSTMTAPFTGEFMGMFAGGALTWLAKKAGLERTQTVIRSVTTAPFEALRRTTLADITQLPSKYLGALSEHAEQAGGKAASQWKPGLVAKADMLSAAGTKIDGHISDAVQPMRTALGTGINAFESTGVGKQLHGLFDKLMNNRGAAAVSRHANHVAKAEEVLTTEATGFFKSIGNKVSGKAAAEVGAGELSSILSGLQKSKGLSGAANVSHLTSVNEELQALMKSDQLKGEVAKRASAVAQHIGKALSSAHAVDSYKSASGESLKTMVKAFGKAAGRVPVFSAIVGVGVAAGIGATMLSARAESSQAKQAFKDLSNELGGDEKSSFMQAAHKAQRNQKRGHFAKTGMELVGGAADGAFMVLPGGGGMAMMGAMMLPQLCGALVPDNELLGAYTALKKHEAGELTLEKPEMRLGLIKQLVASMPAVADHGGVYNKLVGPVATEISERKMNVHAIIQLLGNDAAFTKFASDVDAKQKADAAIAKAKASSAGTVAAELQLTATPSTRITIGKAASQHEGMLETKQLALA